MAYTFDSILVYNYFLGETVPIRQMVHATSTSDVNTATFMDGSTMDGILLSTGQRVLLKNQTTPLENGIYTVQDGIGLIRSDDHSADNYAGGYMIGCRGGLANGAKMFVCTNSAGSDIINTHELGFSRYVTTTGASATSSGVSDNIAIWSNGEIGDAGTTVAELFAPLTVNTGSNEYVLATTQGTNGQVLAATGLGTTQWRDVSSLGGNFSILHSVVNISIIFSGLLASGNISFFSFDNSLYSDFKSTGTCSFWIDSPAVNLYVDIYDGSTILGTTTISSGVAAGAYNFQFTKPTSNKLLRLRAANMALNLGGTNMYSAQLKF